MSSLELLHSLEAVGASESSVLMHIQNMTNHELLGCLLERDRSVLSILPEMGAVERRVARELNARAQSSEYLMDVLQAIFMNYSLTSNRILPTGCISKSVVMPGQNLLKSH